MALVRTFWRLLIPYWKSEERWRGFVLLVCVLALAGFSVYISYLMTRWSKQFYDALQNYDAHGFVILLWRFALIVALSVSTSMARIYAERMLSINWSLWYRRYALDRYFDQAGYYYSGHLSKVRDNPDQRIANDVSAFVGYSVWSLSDLFHNILTLGTFLTVLWGLSAGFTIFGHGIPGFLVWVALLYSVVASTLAQAIGRPLVALDYEQEALGADFRFNLVRVRENAESILFMGGGDAEKSRLDNGLRSIWDNAVKLLKYDMRLTGFTSVVSNVEGQFCTILCVPRFFAREITLGTVFQVSGVFSRVSYALNYIVFHYESIAGWLAVIRRLEGFFQSMDECDQLRASTEARYETTAGDGILLDDITLAFPRQKGRTSPLNFELRPGGTLLLQGRSGVGKSTLIRFLCRFWPYFEGSVQLPRDHKPMVIPQKPYLPIGTLKEAVAYPKAADAYADELVVEALGACGFIDVQDLLYRVEHWTQTLSPGEQQRVAWARAFLHKPDWLFLDEATSAVDGEMQDRLYGALPSRLPGTTVVSVAHRDEVGRYHQRTITLVQAPL